MSSAINIAITGASGKMGKSIIKEIENNNQTNLSILVSHNNDFIAMATNKYPQTQILTSYSQATSYADVLIDFTRPEHSMHNLEDCLKTKTAMVIGTTGFSANQIKKIEQSAKDLPIVLAPNMSLGINLVLSLLKHAGKFLQTQDVDVEIIESHHNKKEDAPSGTALIIGETIANAMEIDMSDNANMDRMNAGGQLRKKNEIGFSSIRAGNIIGDHSVMLALEDEIITIKHHASNRALFAKGAVYAASWLATQSAGKLFSMQDVLSLG